MASTIPAAFAALQSLVGAALPGIQQVVGQFGTYIANEQVIFGDITGVDALGPFTGASPQTFDESYDVTLQARTRIGGTDINARLVRVLAMKNAIRDALANDMHAAATGGSPVVHAVVTRAYLSRYATRSGFDENGVAAEADLVIHIDAYGT
ncbi:MAG TPA: hypothetical protein VFB19_18570 [Mycobacterium sp.]|nr:hypothetical protein [Mycobacterium sp.]